MRLPRNNLTGSLRRSLFSDVPTLRHLELGGNGLSNGVDGASRAELSRLEHLGLRLNNLSYPAEASLVYACHVGGVDCRGFPPRSCLAFGARWAVRSDSSTECVECIDRILAIALLIAMVVLALLAVAAYGYFTIRYPAALKKWVATASILVAHLQTLAIITRLRLAWPASTEAALAFVVVNGLQLEAARPECVIHDPAAEASSAENVNFFFLFSTAKVGLPLLLLLLLASVRWAAQLYVHGCCCSAAAAAADADVEGARMTSSRSAATAATKASAAGAAGAAGAAASRASARLDRLELLETVVFSFFLVGSWAAVEELLKAGRAVGDRDAFAVAGMATALALLSVQLLFVAKYALNTYAMVRQERHLKRRQRRQAGRQAGYEHYEHHGGGGTEAAGQSASTHCYTSTLPLARLQLRLSYTTKRFASHAPFWQFVVWGRQLLQTLVMLLPELLQTPELAQGRTLRGKEARSLVIVWLQAALSLAVLGGFWWYHQRTQPFLFAYQNQLDSTLFLVTIVLIALCAVYTIPDEPVPALEVVLTALLVGSIVGVLVHLLWTQARARRQARAVRAAEAARRSQWTKVDFSSAATWSACSTASDGDALWHGGSIYVRPSSRNEADSHRSMDGTDGDAAEAEPAATHGRGGSARRKGAEGAHGRDDATAADPAGDDAKVDADIRFHHEDLFRHLPPPPPPPPGPPPVASDDTSPPPPYTSCEPPQALRPARYEERLGRARAAAAGGSERARRQVMRCIAHSDEGCVVGEMEAARSTRAAPLQAAPAGVVEGEGTPPQDDGHALDPEMEGEATTPATIAETASASSAGPATAPLPLGWIYVESPFSQAQQRRLPSYYWHPASGRTQWQPPLEPPPVGQSGAEEEQRPVTAEAEAEAFMAQVEHASPHPTDVPGPGRRNSQSRSVLRRSAMRRTSYGRLGDAETAVEAAVAAKGMDEDNAKQSNGRLSSSARARAPAGGLAVPGGGAIGVAVGRGVARRSTQRRHGDGTEALSALVSDGVEL